MLFTLNLIMSCRSLFLRSCIQRVANVWLIAAARRGHRASVSKQLLEMYKKRKSHSDDE